jgi:hypothetical protein
LLIDLGRKELRQMLARPLCVEDNEAGEPLSIHRTHDKGCIHVRIEMALKDCSNFGHRTEIQSGVAARFLFCHPTHPARVLHNRVQRYPTNAIDGARRVFHLSWTCEFNPNDCVIASICFACTSGRLPHVSHALGSVKL